MFDWNDLRYFLAVARQGSTLAAARSMGKSQSTVHRRLGEIEAGMGRALVKRHPTGYRLTPFGHSMLPYAEAVEQAVLELEAHRATVAREEVGIIRLTCPEPIMNLITRSGLLDRFHALHPHLRVEFVLSDSYLDLAKGDADVALRSGDTDDGVLVGRKIAESLWAVYASRQFVELNGKPETIGEICRYPIVALDEKMAGHRFSRWLAEVAPEAAIASRNSSILGLINSAKAGVGIAALPMALGDSEADLIRILGPVSALTRPWRILAHPDLRKTPRVSAFFDFIGTETDVLRPILTGQAARPLPPSPPPPSP
ncbi:MAG: LysR family transcriptional regulator [Paracoccaceae bacterium]